MKHILGNKFHVLCCCTINVETTCGHCFGEPKCWSVHLCVVERADAEKVYVLCALSYEHHDGYGQPIQQTKITHFTAFAVVLIYKLSML